MLNDKAQSNLDQAVIVPYLTYCIEMWGSVCKTHTLNFYMTEAIQKIMCVCVCVCVFIF